MDYWLLLTGTSAAGAPVQGQALRLVSGVHSRGSADYGVDVRIMPGDTSLQAAAQRGAEVAYALLWRENLVREWLSARFDRPDVQATVTGRSAELLFALAVIVENTPATNQVRAIAATGCLDEDGGVHAVDSVALKLRGALERLPPHSYVFFPAANSGEVDVALEDEARARQVRLWPVDTLEEAALRLAVAVHGQTRELPYRGLESFEYRHRAFYFGRNADVSALCALLRRREADGLPGALVIAPSGAGKSSFVQAGVLSALTVGPAALHDKVLLWRVWRPSQAAGRNQAALVESVRQSWQSLTGFGFLREAPALTRFAELLVLLPLHLRERRERLIWVIDQFEEVFQLEFEAAAVAAFAEFLETLQQHGIWVIACLRSDFYVRYQEYGALRRMFGGEGRFDLPHLDDAALGLVIEGPARAAQVRFETDANGTSLAARLLSDMGWPRSLPLLQCALSLLYAQRDATRQLLTYAAYAQIRGINGAISYAADTVLEALDEPARQALPGVLRTLADLPPDWNADSTGAQALERLQPVARVAQRDAWPPYSAERRLVDALLHGRLLADVRDDSGERGSHVRVVHESLLTHWPLARHLLEQDRHDLRLRARLEQIMAHWRATPARKHQPPLVGAELDGAVQLRERLDAAQHPELCAFIGEAIRLAHHEQQAGQRRKAEMRWRLAVMMLVVLGTLGIAALFQQRSERSETRRQEQVASADFLAAAKEQQAERVPQALAYLARSVRQSPDDDVARLSLALLLDELVWTDLPGPHGLRHSGEVADVAFSPDGRRLVSSSSDRSAQLWDLEKGRRLGEPMPHPGPVLMARFSPDGRHIVTAAANNAARVWRGDDAKPEFVFEHEVPVAGATPPERAGSHAGVAPTAELTSVAFSPDGRDVLTASVDGTARLWKLGADRTAAQILTQTGPLMQASFSPDGRRIVTAAQSPPGALAVSGIIGASALSGVDLPEAARLKAADRSVLIGPIAQVWDLRSGKRLGRALRHEGSFTTSSLNGDDYRTVNVPAGVVISAQFSPDGKRVVTAGTDRTARLWNAASGAQAAPPMQHEDVVTRAVFSADGKRIASAANDRSARLWQGASAVAVGDPLRHGGAVTDVSFSPDSRLLLTASLDTTARLWDADSGRVLSRPLFHSSALFAARFSPDGRRIATGGKDGEVRLWSRRDALFAARSVHLPARLQCASPSGDRVFDADRSLITIPEGRRTETGLLRQTILVACAFSPNGKRMVTASTENTVQVWDAASGAPLTDALPQDVGAAGVDFSADGKRFLAYTGTGVVTVWDIVKAKLAGPPLKAHMPLLFVGLNSTGSRVITSADGNAAQIWNVRSGKPSGPLLKHQLALTGALFSPDGSYAATTSFDFSARIWDTETGKALSPPLTHQNVVSGARFSPAGNRLVTYSTDGTARLWEVPAGTAIGEPLRHAQRVTHASFSPDGSLVLTASEDRTVRLWDARTGVPVSAPLLHRDTILHAFITADGSKLVTAAEDDSVRLWTLPVVTNAQAAALGELAETVAGLRVSERDIVEPLPDRNAAAAALRKQFSADVVASDLSRLRQGFLLPPERP